MSPSRSVAALVLAACLTAVLPCAAQQYGSIGRTSRQRSSGGSDFPTWEGDVDRSARDPLPEGPQGHHRPALSIDLGEPATGVVAAGDHVLVVALAAGRVRFVGLDGKTITDVPTGFVLDRPPALAGEGILVSGPRAIAVLTREGIAFTAITAESRLAPACTGDLVVFEAPDGLLEARRLPNGDLAFQCALPAPPSAGPATVGGLLVFGTTDGQIVGVDASNGSVTWTRKVADRIDAVSVDAHAIYASGFGPSSRRKRDSGPIALRLPLDAAGAPAGEAAWRLRMGGACLASPSLLDELVGFPSQDGYFYAVERKKGVGGWRTDLPSRADHSPRLVGGRLDFVLPRTPHVVSLAADNGAVMGYSSLPNPDETFIGEATWTSGLTIAATSFWRLYGFKWQSDQPDGGRADEREQGNEPLAGRLEGALMPQ